VFKKYVAIKISDVCDVDILTDGVHLQMGKKGMNSWKHQLLTELG